MLTDDTVQPSFDVPVRYLCPITGQIMAEPVIAADGHTYEREAIEQWFATSDTSPKTRQKLAHKNLTPNWDKTSDIHEFLNEHPALKKSDELYLPRVWVNALINHVKANQQHEVMKWFAKEVRLLTHPLQNDYTAFHLAAQYGSPELAEIIEAQLEARGELERIKSIPKGFKPTYLNILLEHAFDKKDVTQAALWLKLGAELEQLDTEGNSLLMRLVSRGNLSGITWLLEQGASLSVYNRTGNSCLHMAVVVHEPEIAAFLLRMKADPTLKNAKGQSALTMAVLSQQKDMTAVFLDPKHAALPIYHIALALNDRALMDAILEQGTAPIDALDDLQRTPLGIASEQNYLELASQLLAKGAKLEGISGVEQQTPLQLAARQGHEAVVSYFLSLEANTETMDAEGNTALHLAAKAGHEAVIVRLLEAGAYHKAKNHQNQTPMELARHQGHVQMADFIEQKVRAIKRARLKETGVLRQIIHEQSLRIEQLEKMVAEKSSAQVQEQLTTKYQIGLLEQQFQQRLVLLDRIKTQPPQTPALVFSSPLALKLVENIAAGELSKFLRLVAQGEQDRAEIMLQSNRDLILCSGNVTDELSNRTFEGITAFQYALWALDWHMWQMLLKYLPVNEAKRQALQSTFGFWIQTHNVHVGMPEGPLDKLIKAYEEYNSHYDEWYKNSKWDLFEAQWCKQIGGAQSLLPAHVINEYCRPDRSFEPTPLFLEKVLPRTRKIGAGDWLTTTYNGGLLGDKFAVLRYANGQANAAAGRSGAGQHAAGVRADYRAIVSLTKVRIEQRATLIDELRAMQPAPVALKLVENIATPELSKFLGLVVAGEQDQAEAMLQSNRDLILSSGNVTDLSNRTFNGITAFQYAVWALDGHMWKMLLKYLPVDEAKRQALQFDSGSWVAVHGNHAGALIQRLMQALQTYSNTQSDETKLKAQWCKEVGGAQLLLPTHVINEYCHPNRSFEPMPDFSLESVLPRTRKFHSWIDDQEHGDVFNCPFSHGQLGSAFGLGRFKCSGARGGNGWFWGSPWVPGGSGVDLRAITALLNTRIQQRDRLIAELCSQNLFTFKFDSQIPNFSLSKSSKPHGGSKVNFKLHK